MTLCITMHVETVWADGAVSEVARLGTVRVHGLVGLNIADFGGRDAGNDIGGYTHKIGLAAGGLVYLSLHRHMALTSGIFYSDQGARLALRGEDQGSLDMKYIKFPLLLQVRAPLRGRLVPYVLLGSSLSVLLSAVINSNQGGFADVKDDMTLLDVGVVIGLGASFDVSAGGALVAEAQYTIGTTSTDATDENYDIKNRVWTFSLGYQHRFGR